MTSYPVNIRSIDQSWHQDGIRVSVYCIAILVALSAFSGGLAIAASMLAVFVAICCFRQLEHRGFRRSAIAIIGVFVLVLGQLVAWISGNSGILSSLLGIDFTLNFVQVTSLGLGTLGLLVALKAMDRGSSAIGLLDGVVVTLLVSSRFAAHRDFRWSHPRFLSDWSGINGYELPFVFALVGLAAIVAAMAMGMKTRSWQRSAGSVASIVAMLLLLLMLGSKFVRNPQLAYQSPSAASQLQKGPASGGDATDGGGSEGLPGDAAAADGGAGSANAAAADDPMPTSGRGMTPEPVAMVLLEEDYLPYESTWYFRHTAVSQFNGLRLVTASDSGRDQDIIPGFSASPANVEVPMPEGMHKTVPAVVNLIKEQPRPFGLPSMVGYEAVTNPDPDYFRRSYRATSRVLVNPVVEDEEQDLYSQLCRISSGSSDWDDATLAHYLSHPEDARYAELAKEILSEGLDRDSLAEDVRDSPLLRALAIKRWMEKNTTYSQTEPETDNPAESFLFGERRGYCTHIAHSAVYLMRSIGIPSRIGIGYMVPLERSGKSSSILVQSTDGHAWPEIYLENTGWVVLDIHPERIGEGTSLPPEPDPSATKFLAGKARQTGGHKKQLEAQSHQRRLSWKLRALLTLFVMLLVGYAAKIVIRCMPYVVAQNWLSRAAYLAAVLRLAESGLRRGFGETREQFASRVSASVPELTRLTSAHQSSAFGNRNPQDRSAWLQMLASVRRDIRSSVPAWKRLLGLADPRVWSMLR